MRVGLFQQSISIMMRMLLCYRYLMRPAYYKKFKNVSCQVF